MSEVDLPYDNRTGRGPGRVVRLLGLVLPGVAAVRRQAEPYADHWHAHNREVLGAGGPRRWVLLGDSMLQGVGASSPATGLVENLRARLAASGHDLSVVNLSATGARVPDVIGQQLPAMTSLPPHPDGLPDLVTVLVGSNDLFGGKQHSRALPEEMRRLVELLPRGAVVTTLPQPRDAARQANLHLDRAAAEGAIRLVDLRSDGPVSWRGRLAADFFHPNDAGYDAMADAYEPVLRAALAELWRER